MSSLRTVSRIEQEPATFLWEHATILSEFGHLTQDSGNVSWLLETTTASGSS